MGLYRGLWAPGDRIGAIMRWVSKGFGGSRRWDGAMMRGQPGQGYKWRPQPLELSLPCPAPGKGAMYVALGAVARHLGSSLPLPPCHHPTPTQTASGA